MKGNFLTLAVCASQSIVMAQPISFCGETNAGLTLGAVSKIALGSCASEKKPLPVIDVAAKHNPDVFVWLGDNIYGDTEDMNLFRQKYAMQGCKPEFRNLNKNTFYLAVWDDHDYGVNDGGKEYPKKGESKSLFLEFWGEPKGSARFDHAGIYHSITTGPEGRRVQFILLDGRTFRDSLLWKAKHDSAHFRNDCRPNYSPEATMLGAEQWAWLREKLLEPANLRIICSGTQFGITYNGYEAWANMPIERERMLQLIRETRANGVVFISGDVHYGELSKVNAPNIYPIFDLTSSGITQKWPHVEANQNRVGKAVRQNNFGLIEIDWEQASPQITFSLTDAKNKRVLEHKVSLQSLRF